MHEYNIILMIFDLQLLCSAPSGRTPHYTGDNKKTVIRCQIRQTSRGGLGTPIFCVLMVFETFFRPNIPQIFSSKNCDSSFPGRAVGMYINTNKIQIVKFEMCQKSPQSTVLKISIYQTFYDFFWLHSYMLESPDLRKLSLIIFE